MNINEEMKPYVYSDISVSRNISLPYRLYVPETYDANRKYALMIFLHGAGERGKDNDHLRYEDQYRFLKNVLEDSKLREEFILIAPQCDENCRWVEHNWEDSVYELEETPLSKPMELLIKLFTDVLVKKYSFDMSRIYITGLSMGGFGTWDLLMRYPEFFTAAVPVCGGCDPTKAGSLKNIPIWAFHSKDDNVVPITALLEMKKAFEKLGARDFRSTVYENEGHGSWIKAYKTREAFDWFIEQRK